MVVAPADRIKAWAARRPERILGHNPWQLAAHVGHTALRHRVTGPAAEMSFFAMLTLVPLTVAVGAALGQIQRFVGPEKIARGQDAAISVVRVVISPELTDGVVDPFVRAQLDQRRARPSAACCSPGGWPAACSPPPAAPSTPPTTTGTSGCRSSSG